MIVTLAGEIRRALLGAVVAAAAALCVAVTPAHADQSMSVQPDGRIVVVGSAPVKYRSLTIRFPAAVRFDPNGSLDAAFGSGGGLIDLRPGLFVGSSYTAVATSAGGVLAAGPSLMARFEPDGDADPNFGAEGWVGAAQFSGQSDGTPDPQTVSLLDNGSILVAGNVYVPMQKAPPVPYVAADLLNPDGSYVRPEGRTTLNPADFSSAGDFVRGADGGLVFVGSRGRGSRRGVVGRLSGTELDPAFGSESGFTAFPASEGSFFETAGTALAATTDGYLAAGEELKDGKASLIFVRLNRSGGLETSFGEGGVVRAEFPGSTVVHPVAIAIRPDGMIVVAGGESGCPLAAAEPLAAGCWNAFVARFGADGKLDAAFGNGGVTRFDLPGEGFLAQGVEPSLSPTPKISLALLADSRILVSASNAGVMAVSRFDADGRLDRSFGLDGTATATPCQGTTKELRKIGCFSHASANLRAWALSKDKPAATLRINTDNLLDPMIAVKVVLPRALRARPGLAKRLRVATAPRVPVRKVAKPGRLVAQVGDGARSVRIQIRPGILRRAKRLGPGRKLVFRVLASFMDGSTQRIPVRVAAK